MESRACLGWHLLLISLRRHLLIDGGIPAFPDNFHRFPILDRSAFVQ